MLFLVEAAAYFAVMATLFRARRRFGIGLFFCALGWLVAQEGESASGRLVRLAGRRGIPAPAPHFLAAAPIVR
jgi:hypothetical protein